MQTPSIAFEKSGPGSQRVRSVDARAMRKIFRKRRQYWFMIAGSSSRSLPAARRIVDPLEHPIGAREKLDQPVDGRIGT
jgi:hypothetical protein